MENIDDLVKRNRERAIELMKSHNIKKIDLAPNFKNSIIEYIPVVLYMIDDAQFIDLFVRSIRINDNNIYLTTDYLYPGYEININFTYFHTENNIYVAIEDYLKITYKEHK